MNTNYTLPVEHILQIASQLPLESLSAYSKTCWNIRTHCGMVRLNDLYKSSLETFIGLQERFIFRCKRSEVPVQHINGFVGTLMEKSIQLDSHSTREFECQVGYIFEKNEYFTLTDTTDIKLAEKQFIVAARLGDSTIKDVEYTSLFTSLYLSYNPDTSDLVRTTTFPIKDIQCVFSRTVGITPYEIKAIQAAVKKAAEPELSSFSSFSLK